MKRKLAFVLGTWFGCGRSPVAPGTVGTLFALPVYLAVANHGPPAVLSAAIAMTLVGVWAAGVIVAATGEHDPQIIVIDEVAGVLVALAAAPRSLLGVGLAVVLFRVFDITKPYPARRVERAPRGWGVMLDDVVAGTQAAILLLIARATGVLP